MMRWLYCLKKNLNAPRPSEHLLLFKEDLYSVLSNIRTGQGNVHFSCSADHEQDWQPYPVDPYSAICDDHTYIHTGPTDANAFRGHRLTTQEGDTL